MVKISLGVSMDSVFSLPLSCGIGKLISAMWIALHNKERQKEATRQIKYVCPDWHSTVVVFPMMLYWLCKCKYQLFAILI